LTPLIFGSADLDDRARQGRTDVHVLVVYGSTRGGTAGLAHMVADACAVQGIKTEVRRGGDVRSIDNADAVIVGGALYSNRWHPEAVAFIGRNRAALQRLPVWFFSSGPLDDSARSGALAPVPQVTALAREIEIRGHMTFGGLLDKRPTGLFGMFAYGAEGDFRDRRQVGEWVERIAHELKDGPPQPVRVIEPATGTGSDEVVIATAEPLTVATPAAPETLPPASPSKRSRLRQYLALDAGAEDDDEGLDLFDDLELEPVEELVGDSAGM
jgi:menaquinone-dependent protoporphyrinogen oxidase